MKKINIIKKSVPLSLLAAALLLISTACELNNSSSNTDEISWTDSTVPSLCETYSSYFDVGIAVTGDEIIQTNVQKGIKKHSSTITMGNEFKPQFIFRWWNNKPATSGTFTASNGITIKTPVLNGLSYTDSYLKICKDNNLKMRGHVLVWHSQTDDNFFYEDYDTTKSLVDKDTMTARQEWYIKTVVEHVQNWEKENNDGKHIIWAWDVVNEAAADSGSTLRTSSKWYEIYKNDEFIVNAFRFANKYVSSDVLLCYNDYNCVYSSKRSVMLKILDDVIAAETDSVLPTRINAMGMQSHISVNTSTQDYQKAVTDFLNKGLDVQVTELDIATEKSYDSDQLASIYKDFFTLFINNRKTSDNHGISCVTIWGINDESTWLNSSSQIVWHGNVTQYPLLFKLNKKKEYVTKKAFWSVIEAAD